MKKNSVLILGAGISGIYAAKLFLLKNFKVILYDENPYYDDTLMKDIIKNMDPDFNLFYGNVDDNIFKEIELVVKTVDYENFNKLIEGAKNRSLPIIGELELSFLLSKGTIVAITGSNGKTTTSLLTAEMLKKYYIDVCEVNAKTSPFSKDVLSTESKSAIVIDCEAKELEDISKFKPNVAAILNFNKDSTKSFRTFEDYIKASINIASNMSQSDCLILNYDDEIIRTLSKKKDLFKCKIVFFSSKRVLPEGIFLKDGYIYLKDKSRNMKLCSVFELKLKGVHNYEDIMAAMAISYYMAVPINEIVEVVKNFDPIPNCLEFVKTKGGIDFYNDSNATTPNAVVKAVMSMDAKTILILGGKDSKYDYTELAYQVKDRVRHFVLAGENKKNIASKLRFAHINNIAFADNIEEAVRLANNYANLGDTILFSPGSMPENGMTVEQRGEVFRENVNKIK